MKKNSNSEDNWYCWGKGEEGEEEEGEKRRDVRCTAGEDK